VQRKTAFRSIYSAVGKDQFLARYRLHRRFDLIPQRIEGKARQSEPRTKIIDR
jgi:hypothetical protein